MTRVDVIDLARSLFRSGAPTLTLLGDFKDSFDFDGLAAGV